jgi:predicted transcriptional regulator
VRLLAINKETEIVVPVIMDKNLEVKLKELAKVNRRSRSAQALVYIQQAVERELNEKA